MGYLNNMDMDFMAGYIFGLVLSISAVWFFKRTKQGNPQNEADKRLKKEASWELEKLFDKQKRMQFDTGEDHEWVDTCDVYIRVFQKYRREL